MKWYEKALITTESLGNLSMKANILSNIGDLNKKQKNFIKAIDFYREALQIVIELGLEDSSKAKKLEYNIGECT